MIRDAILRRLDELGRSRYWLAQQLAERGVLMADDALYRYLRGERQTSYRTLEAILDILDLEVTPCATLSPSPR